MSPLDQLKINSLGAALDLIRQNSDKVTEGLAKAAEKAGDKGASTQVGIDIIELIATIFAEIKKLPEPVAQRFYQVCYNNFISLFIAHPKINRDEMFAFFAFSGPFMRKSHIESLVAIFQAAGGAYSEIISKHSSTLLILLDIYEKRSNNSELDNLLTEMRDSAIDIASEIEQESSGLSHSDFTAIISGVVMERLYNAFYWYLYGERESHQGS